jgi:predicted nucleic acid-binding protein
LGTLLLDASVILAAFDSDDVLHDAAKTILSDAEATLATLDLARYEVANVAVRAWRSSAQVSPLLDAIDRLADDGGVMLATTALLTRATKLAEQHGISVYDAAYVAAASQAGAALISCDMRDLVSKGLASSPDDIAASISASSQSGGSEAEEA